MNKTLFGLGSLSLIASAIPSAQAQNDKRPNILVILADDLGYSDLGCYGGEIETPNLDRLAANGMRFTRFYNASRSCPTRASLLTGLYPHQAGVGRMTFDAGKPGYRGTMTHNGVTVAEVLSGAGYQTGMIGKWHVAETPLRPDQRQWLAHQVYHDEFAPKENYPTHRGFQDFYGTIYGVVDYFDPFSLVNGEEPVKSVPADYYSTVALADSTVSYIHRYSGNDNPFFIYLSFHAPHWPLHALPEDIKKYEDMYTCGWDAIRERRYEKMKKLGIFGGSDNFLSPRQFTDLWEENPTAEWDAHAMAVHAAMVDRMDQEIGKVIKALQESGELDNTLILFMSDNGCSNEDCQNYAEGENDRPAEMRSGEKIFYPKEKEMLPGPENTYASIGAKWANVANTPFRYWKAKSFEGGICTPMIACWPEGIAAKGEISTEMGHVIDLMATCLDLSGARYPEVYNGNPIIPYEGISLVPAFRGGQREGHRELCFEHFNERAMIDGSGWKIVKPAGRDAAWELYDLNNDRTELVDLAQRYPEKVTEMGKRYLEWEQRCMVEPRPQ